MVAAYPRLDCQVDLIIPPALQQFTKKLVARYGENLILVPNLRPGKNVIEHTLSGPGSPFTVRQLFTAEFGRHDGTPDQFGLPMAPKKPDYVESWMVSLVGNNIFRSATEGSVQWCFEVHNAEIFISRDAGWELVHREAEGIAAPPPSTERGDTWPEPVESNLNRVAYVDVSFCAANKQLAGYVKRMIAAGANRVHDELQLDMANPEQRRLFFQMQRDVL